jgi:hypothetical protein
MYAQIVDRSPMRIFEESIHGGLAAGELGTVTGRAGVGKSQTLVHVALDRLFRDEQVLHISLRESAKQVRTLYTEIFDGVARTAKVRGRERDQALVHVEANRQILCFLDREYGVDDFIQALDFASRFMELEPSIVILDGIQGDNADILTQLRALAGQRNFALWTSCRTHRDQDSAIPCRDVFDTIVTLDPVDTVVEVRAVKVHGADVSEPTGLHLHPGTMLVTGEETWDAASAPPSPRSEDCTLYSGGAPGAEAAFGENAARFSLGEVNFTFDGHRQARTHNSHALSQRELAAGDVSLVYVSKRLNRTYSEGSMIRKVLQSLWHQVSRAQQVFVVGTIQDDGTVTGGTGWSVELARMWHKDLWVYDQDKNGWYHWSGERWIGGVPVVESPHFCGTGTRSLNENGQAAIAALFDRSFGVPR